MSARLRAQFEAGTLNPEAFTHVDHVRVAVELLGRYSFLEATARFGRGAEALAARAGAPEKFNATVTLAFMSLIGECLSRGDYRDAEELLLAHPELADRHLLSRWYSPARLASARARRMFVLPDRWQAPTG